MQMLSHSQLETWQTCPLRWKFQRVDKLPEEPQEALVLGIAVHAAIEADNRARLEGQPAMTQDALAAKAQHTLQGSAESALAPLLPDLAARAGVILSVYARQVQPLFHPLAVESWFRFDLPAHPGWAFTGRIDALVQNNAGQTLIVDYKTGARGWGPGHEHRAAQATAYVWAMQQAGRDMPVVVFIPLVVSASIWGYTARYELRRTERTPEDIALYQRVIARVIGEMQEASVTSSYPARPGWHCRWCPYRSCCPAQAG